MTGTVKFFKTEKGFGFIKDDDSDAEYFFHFSKTLDIVKMDDRVAFEIEEDNKGTHAYDVKRLK